MPGTTYTPRELIDKLISFDTTSRLSNSGVDRLRSGLPGRLGC